MKLWQKTVLIMLATLAMLMVSFYLIIRFVMLHNFESLEVEVAQDDTQAARGVLVWYQGRMLRNLTDWANWDDTYSYMQSRDPEYLRANFFPATYINNDIDLVALYDRDGAAVFGQIFARGRAEVLPLPVDIQKRLVKIFHLRAGAVARPASRIFHMDGRLMLLAMHPIHKSDATEPANGTMIMGRFLDATLAAEFSAILNDAPVAFQNILESPAAFALARQMDQLQETWILDQYTPQSMRARILLYDNASAFEDRRPVGFLDVKLTRPVQAHAETTTALMLGLFLAAGACFCIGVFWLLHTQVLRRMQKMIRETERISSRIDSAMRLQSDGADELSDLAGAINHMLVSLQKAEAARRHFEEKLEQSKRLQAIGTLAAGVAHEINNPLNSLLLRMGTLQMQLEDGRVPPREKMLARVCDLTADIERIGEIVRHMRSLVRGQGREEAACAPVEIQAMVDLSLALMQSQLDTHSIAVTLELPADLPPVLAVMREVELVMVNLLTNALQAMVAADVEQPKIKISAYLKRDCVVLEVEDNGPGLQEAQESVFDPFFTTKGEGESMGVGLAIVFNMITHWGASIEAGASLLGGAKFSIELRPATAEESS